MTDESREDLLTEEEYSQMRQDALASLWRDSRWTWSDAPPFATCFLGAFLVSGYGFLTERMEFVWGGLLALVVSLYSVFIALRPE